MNGEKKEAKTEDQKNDADRKDRGSGIMREEDEVERSDGRDREKSSGCTESEKERER